MGKGNVKVYLRIKVPAGIYIVSNRAVRITHYLATIFVGLGWCLTALSQRFLVVIHASTRSLQQWLRNHCGSETTVGGNVQKRV